MNLNICTILFDCNMMKNALYFLLHNLIGENMATLQVRDLPDQIYEKLKKEAREKHRSLAQQAIVTLAKGLDTSYDARERRSLLLDNLHKEKNDQKRYNLSDPVKIIREDRER
jgi:plasmid stability protein